MSRRTLRLAVLAYVGFLVGAPVILVFYRAFQPGWSALVGALEDPQMDTAMWFTLRVVAVALPLNVVAGVGASLWIVRHPSWMSRFLDTVIDVPLAISPIIVGLMIELAYAQNGWLGSTTAALHLQLVFSYWGVVLASVFVSLPLVSRQVIPLLREIGDHQEQTAATLGAGPVRIFWSITLRSIQWSTAYGVTLTLARVIGEYGAVLVVSGNIAFVTQTLTLDIASNFDNFDNYQGFVGAAILATTSVIVLAALSVARHRERQRLVHRS